MAHPHWAQPAALEGCHGQQPEGDDEGGVGRLQQRLCEPQGGKESEEADGACGHRAHLEDGRSDEFT